MKKVVEIGSAAEEILELDHSEVDNTGTITLSQTEAKNLFGVIPKKVAKQTIAHLENPPRCFCGTKLRFSKKEGELCDSCIKGIHRKIFTTLADAEAV